jgi:hypothetical protein
MAPARRDGASWGRQAPGGPPAPAGGLAFANVLMAGDQLNSDGLDPDHGLVAVNAARVVSRS